MDNIFFSFSVWFRRREYKEALRQQRNQDSSSIYRPKDQTPTPTNGNAPIGGPKSQTMSPTHYSNQNSPTFVHSKTIISDSTVVSPNQNGHSPLMSIKHQPNDNSIQKMDETIAIITSPSTSAHRKPVQKVTPSRNMNALSTYKSVPPTTAPTNGNSTGVPLTECVGYVKPNSPTHVAGSYYSNTMPASTQSMSKIAVSNKAGTQKPNR